MPKRGHRGWRGRPGQVEAAAAAPVLRVLGPITIAGEQLVAVLVDRRTLDRWRQLAETTAPVAAVVGPR